MQDNNYNYAAIEAFNPEIEPLLMRYCQHTGKPLGQITAIEFNNLITTHGLPITKSILEYTQLGTSPEWIWQNAEGLSNLCIWQPKEYFIFAMSKLMFPATSNGTGQQSKQDKAFQDKIIAWQNIQEIDIEIVKPVSELCRRIIAKCNPAILAKVLLKCQQTDVHKITASLDSMAAFHLELEDLLKWLVDNLRKLEAEDKRGFANFAGQKMIIGLSTLELEVHREMNDFELIPDKSADTVEMLVGKQYGKAAKAAKKKQYSCKPLEIDCGNEQSAPKLSFNTAQAVDKPIAKSPLQDLHTKQVNKPAFKPSFNLPKGDK